MTQSKQEADKLMEKQRLGGAQPSDIDDDFDEYDEDEDDYDYDIECDINEICATCGHIREAHVEYEEDCSEDNCDCTKFKEEQ